VTDPGLFGMEFGSEEHLWILGKLAVGIVTASIASASNFSRVYGITGDTNTGKFISGTDIKEGEALILKHGIPTWIVSDLGDFDLKGYMTDRGGVESFLIRGLLEDVLRSVGQVHSTTNDQNLGGNLCHGNVCPSNIIVFVRPGTVAFGVSDAYLYDVFEMVCGSPYGNKFYQAPEALRLRRCAKSDVYSIGITIATCIVEFMGVAGFDRIPEPEKCFGLQGRAVLVAEACARLLALPKSQGRGMAAILKRMVSDNVEDRLDVMTALQRVRLIPYESYGTGPPPDTELSKQFAANSGALCSLIEPPSGKEGVPLGVTPTLPGEVEGGEATDPAPASEPAKRTAFPSWYGYVPGYDSVCGRPGSVSDRIANGAML
jgi:hypothetical protein